MLEIQKQYHEWMPQEIALTFTTKFPMLGLNILQIKRHLKHINCKKNDNLLTLINKIQMEMEKIYIYYHSPWKKPSIEKKIGNTNTQYIVTKKGEVLHRCRIKTDTYCLSPSLPDPLAIAHSDRASFDDRTWSSLVQCSDTWTVCSRPLKVTTIERLDLRLTGMVPHRIAPHPTTSWQTNRRKISSTASLFHSQKSPTTQAHINPT